MDTASSFTLRKNAKRAAEAMIRKGTAPAVDYGIKPRDDGRFEIVWKSAMTATTIDEVVMIPSPGTLWRDSLVAYSLRSNAARRLRPL